jgi:hypothetical protein
MAILTSNKAVPFVAEVERNLPILMNGNVQYDKKRMAGDGDSMDVLIPGYGVTGTGADMTSTSRTYANQKRTVTLTQYHKGVDLTFVEKALKLSSFEDQVAVPYGSEMASEIQKAAVVEMQNAATSAVIIESGTGDYKNIGKAIGYIKAARATGPMCIAMENTLSQEVQDSGLNFFQADLKQSFLEGSLGRFRGAKGYETPDIESLQTGARTVTGALTLDAKIVDGATSFTFSAATTLTGDINAGEIIYIADAKAVDVYGNATNADRAFVVKADATAAANALTVTVDPIYTTGQLQNVGGDAVASAEIAASSVVTIETDSNATYLRGLVWAKDAFVIASSKMTPLEMTKLVASASGKSTNVIMQAGSDIITGKNIYRWDALYGFLMARDNWVSQVLVKTS